jgi:glycosyltransferase involved in cell wall biosynthesis
MSTRIIIDPISNVYYSGFYIQGLYDKFGKKNVRYNSTPFLSITNRADNFNFIAIEDGVETKYSIHVDDPYEIKISHYDWCDVYGNVNANFEKIPSEFHSKLVSLVPSFGIRIWNLPETIFYAIINALKINKKINFRKFWGKYKRQWELRLPYSDYLSQPNCNALGSYIFHISTLWYNDEWNKNDEGVNKTRANFIKACKSIDKVEFEGGLAVTNKSIVNSEFLSCIYEGEVSMKDYLCKIKRSMLVFNTPAFWNCHGWKLGEYLALGKAIISTKLSNDLPALLIHGEHIHIVENDEEEIRKAILLIMHDTNYRRKLEKGAKDYWAKYGTPTKSLELLGLK